MDLIERYVGSRIRLRRKILGLRQECLAAALGVSYQQVQKYETGSSRICAGRLHMIARALDVPISYFFPPSPEDGSTDEECSSSVIELLSSSDAVELSLAAMQVGDANVRREIIQLVRSIALATDETPPPAEDASKTSIQ